MAAKMPLSAVFLSVIASCAINASAASDSFQARVQALFNSDRAVEPTKQQLILSWICFYDGYRSISDPIHRITLGSLFSPMIKDGGAYLGKFGRSVVPLKSTNRALVAETELDGIKVFAAIRIVPTHKGLRIIVEESSDQGPQSELPKSPVTGHPSSLYMICLEENKLESALLEK